jgi:hypothetical protein
MPASGQLTQVVLDPMLRCYRKNFGAGEGARTLDPDLGKVVFFSRIILIVLIFRSFAASAAHALPKITHFNFRIASVR